MLPLQLVKIARKRAEAGVQNKDVVKSTVMQSERGDYTRELDKRNTSDEITGDRVYENLQIDGEKPSRGLVRQIIAKIKDRKNGQRTNNRPSE